MEGHKDCRVCRVCLRDSETKIMSLFENYKESQIYLYINALTSIDIQENDGMPNSICKYCLMDLENAIQFKERCVVSDTFLRKTAAELKDHTANDTTDTPEIKEEKEEYNIEFDDLAHCASDLEEEQLKNEVPKTYLVGLEKQKNSSTEYKVECGDCGTFFKSQCKLRVHWKKEHLSKQCPKCKQSFKTPKSFDHHVKRNSKFCRAASQFNIEVTGKIRLFSCKSCSFKSIHIKDAAAHIEIHTDEQLYSCELCDETFKQISLLDAHRECSHKNYNEVKKSKAIDLHLECDDCGNFFPSKCKLRVHWKRAHLRDKLTCPTCKRSFNIQKSFNHHIKHKTKACKAASQFHIEVTGTKKIKRVFTCKLCPYKTIRIKDAAAHVTVHTGEKPFSCDLCGKSFTQQCSLDSHKECVHKQYKVVTTCHVCGKFLKGRCNVYRHLKAHEAKKLQCKICKKFLKPQGLKTHMKRHSGVKMYTCELCAVTFYTMSELCNHRRLIHNPNAGFKCDICGYRTVKKLVLMKHVTKHSSGDLPCTTCGRFYETHFHLKMHQRLHNDSSNRKQCPFCDLTYTRNDSVKQHVKRRHMNLLEAARRAIKEEKEATKSVLIEPSSPTTP